MTPAEYLQLKAFSRLDGAILAVLWTGSFACYVMGMTNPVYGLTAAILAVVSPFFVARRLRQFRDQVLGGQLSFLRGLAFCILVFFYAAILFAVVQYVYFAFIDNGYLAATITQLLESDEGRQALAAYGMEPTLTESLEQLRAMRPIDIALNVLTVNITLGILLGLPVAALLQRRAGKKA